MEVRAGKYSVRRLPAGVLMYLAEHAHHDQLRMTWHATAPDEQEPAAIGFDVIVHREGRIRQVLGFLDRAPVT